MAGVWFSLFPTLEGLVAQAGALVFVLGSYYIVAQYLRMWRPRRRHGVAAYRPEAAPKLRA